tara:strand:- start:364 stop:726 length:363 start_codon:yes stop_codon:yes gene_type:complete
MIDTDEYIEMWDDNLLGSEGVQILMNTLIAEVKRLQKSSKEALTNYNELKILVKEVGEGITFCMYCDLPYSDAEGRDCDCCPFCEAYDPDDFDFREDACSDCREEAAAGHPSLSAWERNQ